MRFHIFEVSAHDFENGGQRFDDFGQPVLEAGENVAKLKICIKFIDIRNIVQIGRFEAIPVPNDPAIADNLGQPEPQGGGLLGALQREARPAVRRGAAPRQPRPQRRYIIDPNHYTLNTSNGTFTVFGNFDAFAEILTQFRNGRELAE